MMMPIHQFKAPSLIVNGPGAAKEVGFYAKGLGRKALIVTDNLLEKIGLLDDIKKSLEAAEISFAIYDKVVTEPTMQYTEEGIRIYKEFGAELLIAIGGGSPIDTAKAISALASNPGKMNDFEGANKIPKPGAPAYRHTHNGRDRKRGDPGYHHHRYREKCEDADCELQHHAPGCAR
jgi:alcohol dehydrogenase class IV